MIIKSNKRKDIQIYYITTTIFFINLILILLLWLESPYITYPVFHFFISHMAIIRMFPLFVIPFSLLEIKINPLDPNVIKAKLPLFCLIEILFILYTLIIFKLNKGNLFNETALNMCILFIPIALYQIKKLPECTEENDRQVQWQKAMGTYVEKPPLTTTFFWRYKISFKDLNKNITRKELFKALVKTLINRIFLTLLLLSFFITYYYDNKSIYLISIMLIPSLLNVIYHIIEITFNLSTYLEGHCNDEFEESSGKSTNITYYYIITDYTRKREIKISSKSPLYINKGDYMRIYYAALSKEVIKYHNIQKN